MGYVIKQFHQPRYVLFAAVQLLRDLKRPRNVRLPQLESRDGPTSLQLVATALQIGDQSVRALVAVFGVLGHQLRDDPREGRRNLSIDVASRRRSHADVAMDPLERIVGREGELPGEQLEEGDAQRVVVGAVVQIPAYPARLFRRHVWQ